MTKIKIYIAIAFIIICVLYLVSIFEIKDQYDKELNDLRKENTKLKIDNKKHIRTIESLLDGVECDCGWYEDWYYQTAEGCGANE